MKTAAKLGRAVGRVHCTSAGQTAVAAPAFAKPYEEIPGPRGPFGLGNLYKYLPLIGDYSWLQLHKASRDKYERYGAIVRETMVPGEDIVWLFDPNDIATLLNERDYPQRRSHLALEKYRLERPHIYRSAGLLPTNGPEWWRLRSEFQKEISVPKNVRSFLTDVDKVTQDFLEHLPTEERFDMLPELSRLNLELTCMLTFNERLMSFSSEERDPKSRSSRLIRAAEITNSSILPTDQGLQLWRRFETPTYKRLRKAQEYMESVAIDLVTQKFSYFKENNTSESGAPNSMERTSLIEEFLKNPKLDLCDIVGIAADLLLAGIDTTSYTMAFAVYHIARHPEVQRKLLEESQKVLPSAAAPLSVDVLRTEVPYTRAVLKEVFRLNPISVGVGRILNKDLVLSGYHVPKGTVVVTQNITACRLAKYFHNPCMFSPERWLQRKNALNPYLVLPFGHGMRACIARRLSEQNILVFLLRLMRHHEVIWAGGNGAIDIRTQLINKPSKPVTVLLKQRKC